MGDHWSNEFEHGSVTTENRDAFNTHMAKFPTQADAVMDGYGLAKLKGAAFKLPESIESLSDDTMRADFTSKVNNLFGRVVASDMAGLADLDLKAGSTSDAMDEALVGAFKQFIIDEKISKGDAQKMIGFHNKAMGLARTAHTTAVSVADKKEADEQLAAVTTCRDTLTTKFGTKEKLDEQEIKMHRAIIGNVGCSPEEAEDVAEFLKSREGSTNPTIRRILISTLAPLATESSMHGAGDGKTPVTEPKSDQDKQVEKDIWG